MDTTHADLPWSTDFIVMNDGNIAIEDSDGCIVALVPPAFVFGEPIQEDNAEFIVNACNAYDDLVRELRAAADFLESAGFDATPARAALAYATGDDHGNRQQPGDQ
jgi:hypothetical protein